MSSVRIPVGKTWAEVSVEDAHLAQYTWWPNTGGYAVTEWGGRHYTMHSLVLQRAGACDGCCIDHINRHILDNRRENLRVVSQQQNVWHSGKAKHGTTSIYKGVSAYKGRWRAR